MSLTDVWLLMGGISGFCSGLLMFFLIWYSANRAKLMTIYGLSLAVVFWLMTGATLATVHLNATHTWYGHMLVVACTIIGLFTLEIFKFWRFEVWARIQLWICKLQKAIGIVK